MPGFRTYSRCKRGFVGDVLMIMILLFITGVVIMAAYLTLSSINTAFQGKDEMGTTAKKIVADSTSSYINTWDGIFAFLFIGLSIAAVIGAYMIDTHPIFLIFALVLIGIFIVIGAVISNAYYEVESASPFNTYADQFRIMHYINNHWPFYVLIEGVLIVLALYGKTRQQ